MRICILLPKKRKTANIQILISAVLSLSNDTQIGVREKERKNAINDRAKAISDALQAQTLIKFVLECCFPFLLPAIYFI